MNRILAGIEKYEDCVKRGVRVDNGEPVDSHALSALDKDIKFKSKEVRKFQDLKTRAQLHGLLTEEEATTIYQYLGGEAGTSDHINGQSLGARLFLTKILGELLGLAVKGKI